MTLLKLQQAFKTITGVTPPTGHTTVAQFTKWISRPMFRSYVEEVMLKAGQLPG